MNFQSSPGFHISAVRAYQVLDQSTPCCCMNVRPLCRGSLGSARTGCALAVISATDKALVKPASFSYPADARTATVSLKGKLPIMSIDSDGLAAFWVCDPRVVTSNSVVVRSGSLWIIRTVPPNDPDPYRVPCGPRSISTRA